MMQLLLVLLIVAAVLGFCAKREAPSPPPPDQGREETRFLETAPSGGVDNQAVRQKLDRALELNEQRPQQLEQQIEQQEQ